MARLRSLLLLVLALTGEAEFATSASSPIVSVPFKDGNTVAFEGTEVKGRNGKHVDAFYGIPFGEEPGRWRDPVMKTWEETTTTVDASATNFSACLQVYNPSLGLDPNFTSRLIGENDCLKLNVWKPNNAASSSDFPVMVYILGGSFVQGGIAIARDAVLHDGNILLGETLVDNTVVVTLQYRLGPLGWLGSNELRNRSAINSTGNYGLLDQRLALQWVHEHIQAFGGDPKKVFVFGESAGAICVSAHLMSEGSWPYFSSAGMQSGAFNANNFRPMNMSQGLFENVMKSQNCTTVDCLLNTSDETLFLNSPNIGYTLSIDGVVIKEDVATALASDHVAKVPMLMGHNLNEGTMSVSSGGPYGGLGPNTTEADLEKMRCGLGPNYHAGLMLMDEEDGNITPSLAEAFNFSQLPIPTPAYTLTEIITPAYWEGVAIATAGIFGCGTVNAAEALSNKSAIYAYELRAQTELAPPFAGLHEAEKPVPGSAAVTHAIDLFFVWSGVKYITDVVMPYWDVAPFAGMETITMDQKETLSRTMSQAWINFAKTHKPGFGWQPWTAENPNRAIFDYNTEVDTIKNEKAGQAVLQCELMDRFSTCVYF